MPELSIPSFLLLLYSAYALAFMEGLFFFTRPAFLSITDPLEIVSSLFVSALFIWIPGLVLWLVGFAIDLLIHQLKRQNAQVCLVLALVSLTMLLVLMVDNFSYTIFKIGIIHAKGYQRYLYLGITLVVFLLLYWRIGKSIREYRSLFRHRLVFFALTLPLMVSLFTFFGKFIFAGSPGTVSESGYGVRTSLPNIIFFASDGIDANRLSLYGYQRNTTPKLNLFAKERPPLLCENAFSNGARTTGSVTSMLTGKAPATNKVFFPPHILENAEAQRHLPGILKKLGYVNFQETIRYYADAGDLNLQGAFDVANNRSLYSPGFLGRHFVTENYFLAAVVDRIRQRSLHLAGIRPMEDVYTQMTRPQDKPSEVYGTNDDTRMERFFKFAEDTKTPFFAHLHLLDSHCCGYKIRRAFFSARSEDDDEGPSAGDLMDDTILGSDDHFGHLLDFLKARGLLANTLIVYSSDHNRGWTVKKRTPLMFFFPDGKNARVEEKNCQLLDIMPTILDSLGHKLPAWLEGRSLLRPQQLTSDRPIFGFLNINRRPIKIGASAVTTLTDAGPPFYGLSSYGMVSCDRWYELNLNHGGMTSGAITGHSGDCEDIEELEHAQAKRRIIRHLQIKKVGFRFKDAG
jgi:arylsulfatase A-like enzyme